MASILLVDDEEAVLGFVKRLLQLHGNAVDTAADGSQALDRLQRAQYDLLLLDRMMPGVSGLDVVHVVRSSPQHDDMKILMLTATSVTRDVDEAFKSGVDGYVVKPPNVDKLVEKVRQLTADKNGPKQGP